jgi:hypothetical protein
MDRSPGTVWAVPPADSITFLVAASSSTVREFSANAAPACANAIAIA